MMYESLTLLFLSVTLFGGCFNGENDVYEAEDSPAEIVTVDSSFLAFADSIPILPPNTILTSEESFDHVDLRSEFIPDGAALIGRLVPFRNHELIVYSYPADIRLPILEVYNSMGQKVNERQLFKYGGCPITSENGHVTRFSESLEKVYIETYCSTAVPANVQDSIIVNDLVPN